MTTTQIYWNTKLNCCMTRLWYEERTENEKGELVGKIVQKMKEIPTPEEAADKFMSSRYCTVPITFEV